MTGVMRRVRAEFKGDVYDCDIFVLDEPIDAFVASYPVKNGGPSLHEGVTSAVVFWQGECTGSLVDKRLRVSGTVVAGGKWTPWMDADGTLHEAAGVLAIHDATYELL